MCALDCSLFPTDLVSRIFLGDAICMIVSTVFRAGTLGGGKQPQELFCLAISRLFYVDAVPEGAGVH
jgi:hypothetical protein